MSRSKTLKRPTKHDYRCPTCGARRGLSLTPDDVRAIRALLASGTTQVTLARVYGVTPQAIYRIGARKNWKNL